MNAGKHLIVVALILETLTRSDSKIVTEKAFI